MPTARMLDSIRTMVRPLDDHTDGVLLSQFIAQRDGAAFAELVRRHAPLVFGVCRRILGNRADADDAFQATFFVFARRSNTIRSSAAIGSWLYAVAVKVALKARRQAIKRRMRQMAAAKPEAVYPMAPAADLWSVIHDELAKLPEQLRQAFLLCDVTGESRSQAARELGWPEGTVAKRLAKARKDLASRLTRRGITLSAGALSATLTMDASAVVPTQLVNETATQAAAFAVGTVAGSFAVRSLAEGIMRSMTSGGVKTRVLASFLAITLVGSGMMAGGIDEKPSAKPADKVETPKTVAQPVLPAVDHTRWKETVVLETPGWLPGSVAYSPDGKTLVVGGTGGKVLAVSTSTHKKLWDADLGGGFAAVAFSSDGKTLAATFQDGVRFLDPETGKAGEALEELKSDPKALAFFPDEVLRTTSLPRVSRKVIFGNARGYFVKTWLEWPKVSTIRTSTVSRGKEPADPNAVPLAIDVVGRSAVITGPINRETAKNVLWAYACGGPGGNHLLDGHKATVVSAAWSKDGKTAVSGDADGLVIVWDALKFKETSRLTLPGRIASLAIAADGSRIAAAAAAPQERKAGEAYAEEVFVWETKSPPGKPTPISQHIVGSPFTGVASVAFSPDGKSLAACFSNFDHLTKLFELSGKVRVWEIASDAKPKPETKPVEPLVWKADKPIIDPEFDIQALAVSDDGTKFGVASGGETIVRDAASLKTLYTASGSYPRFVGADLYTWFGEMNQHDAITGKEKKAFPKAKTEFAWHVAAISPDGKTVAGYDGTEVQLRDVGTGFEPVRLGGQGKLLGGSTATAGLPVTGIAWSPDGTRVAGFHMMTDLGGEGGLAVWDAENGKKLAFRARDPLSARPMCLAWSPDSKTIAVGGLTGDSEKNSSITLLNSANLKDIRGTTIRSRDGGADVTAVAFSPAGNTVAIGVKLHTGTSPLVRVQLWDTNTGLIRDSLLPDHETPPIRSLAFSPDGTMLIAGTGTGPNSEPQSKEVAHRLLIWRASTEK